MAQKGSSKPGGKKRPTRITGAQRAARKRNIKIAQAARTKGGIRHTKQYKRARKYGAGPKEAKRLASKAISMKKSFSKMDTSTWTDF